MWLNINLFGRIHIPKFTVQRCLQKNDRKSTTYSQVLKFIAVEGSQRTLKVSIANFGISIVTNKFIPKYHKYHFVLSDENELVHTSTRTIFLVLDKPKIASDKILFCYFFASKNLFQRWNFNIWAAQGDLCILSKHYDGK